MDIQTPMGYSVELRLKKGNDSGLPNAGIVVHQLNFGSGSHDPILMLNNRRATASIPGDVFYDPVNHVEVCVKAQTENGFTVVIANGKGNRCGFTTYLPLVVRL